MTTKRTALAKLSRPRLHQAVARPRLFEALDEACRRPLVWVAAPPGSGKTTLIATYLERNAVPALWYQVDAGDSDPAAFFHYLTSAARHASSHRSATLPVLVAEHLTDLRLFTQRFFRHLFGLLPHSSVLVLDNFQEAAESGLSAILRSACAEIPEGINVIAISRTAPAPVLAEAEASGALASIDWFALRLTLDETRAMCAARGVAEDWVVRALHQQSDGWAAGITLMVERLKRAGDGAGTISGETRESVFNYFASLILDQAPQRARETLLAIAFPPRVTPSLAQALSGDAEAGKLLDSLHRRQLFTDRRPGPEPVYQFHALFQEFLRTKAAQGLSRAQLCERLRRSGLELQQRGDWEAAFDLLVDAEAWDEAGALTVAHAPALLESGRWQTLSRWIDRLPAPRQPWLDYWLGRAQSQTDPKQSVASFQRAETRFAHAGERTGRILSIAGLLQACCVDHTDYQTIDPWLDVLADELATLPSSLTAEQALIAWGALLFAAFFARPWHPCVLAGLDRIEALLGSVRSPAVALAAATSALTVASQTSQMDRCERLASTVRALAAMPDMSPVLAAWGLFQVAAAAEAAMRRVEALPAPQHPLSNGLLTCYRARLSQLRGQPQTAADLAQRADTDIIATGAGFHLAIYGLINGEIMLGAGRVGQARPLIERARAVIERSAALSNLRASLALVEAWVAQQEAREADCLRLLQQALALSQVDYGWCQMRFVDTTATHMLPVALQRGIQPDAASRLIRLFRLRPPHPDAEGWPWPVRIHTFGRFEVRVDDRPLEFERKAPKKALALLKALVTLGPREVPDAKLVDALWPDEDGDAGQKALSVTLLRLRRLLGDNDLIHAQGGRMSLNRTRCWVDAWTFEDRLTAMPLGTGAGATGLPTLRRALSVYGGSFLPDDAELSWTVPVRERLRSKFIHGLATLGTHLEDEASYDEAIAWYLRGLDADSIVEPFYQGLMRCYDKLDRRTEAVAAYRRLRQTLSVTLGLQPAASSERLYQSLLTG